MPSTISLAERNGRNSRPIENSQGIHIQTDGSKNETGIGAGFFCDNQVRCKFNNYNFVFITEIVGMTQTVKRVIALRGKSITLLVDSKTAIKAKERAKERVNASEHAKGQLTDSHGKRQRISVGSRVTRVWKITKR